MVVFNIIPDRNYTPGAPDQKLANLEKVIRLTEELELPLLGGTEMNSPGQKFVDDFESAELSPFHPVFLRGSRILHAHSTLQRHCGMGYLSDWAQDQFSGVGVKNEFYAEFGDVFSPRADQRLADSLNSEMGVSEVLTLARESMGQA